MVIKVVRGHFLEVRGGMKFVENSSLEMFSEFLGIFSTQLKSETQGAEQKFGK